jgi:hypothetical protein
MRFGGVLYAVVPSPALVGALCRNASLPRSDKMLAQYRIVDLPDNAPIFRAVYQLSEKCQVRRAQFAPNLSAMTH